MPAICPPTFGGSGAETSLFLRLSNSCYYYVDVYYRFQTRVDCSLCVSVVSRVRLTAATDRFQTRTTTAHLSFACRLWIAITLSGAHHTWRLIGLWAELNLSFSVFVTCLLIGFNCHLFVCAFYWLLEFCIPLFGLVLFITLSFAVSECFVYFFGLCHFVCLSPCHLLCQSVLFTFWTLSFCDLLLCLCRTFPPLDHLDEPEGATR